jgi:hypothetical protein
MGNSRSFRRRLAASKRAPQARYPSAPPSLGTVRRWLNQSVAEGNATKEPAPRKPGQRGNTGYQYRITEKGIAADGADCENGVPWEECILVGCPTCKAVPGKVCRTLRARRKRGWWPHDSRMALWKRTVNEPILAETRKELAGVARAGQNGSEEKRDA